MQLNLNDLQDYKRFEIKSFRNKQFVRFFKLDAKYANAYGNDQLFAACSDFDGCKFRFKKSDKINSTVVIICEGHEYEDGYVTRKDFVVTGDSSGKLCVNDEVRNKYGDQFKINFNSDNTISLYSWSCQKWVSAENGPLIANKAHIGLWEKFLILEKY